MKNALFFLLAFNLQFIQSQSNGEIANSIYGDYFQERRNRNLTFFNRGRHHRRNNNTQNDSNLNQIENDHKEFKEQIKDLEDQLAKAKEEIDELYNNQDTLEKNVLNAFEKQRDVNMELWEEIQSLKQDKHSIIVGTSGDKNTQQTVNNQ